MEGSRRGAALAATLLAGCALIAAATGCGDDESSAVSADAIVTGDPERTFAPLLEVAADEPWRPLAARWFIERSMFGMTGCGDRPIAVGRTMPERRTDVTNWIFIKSLGSSARVGYYRNPYLRDCERDYDRRLYADQLTRPHDPGPRLEGLSPDQGFYLDLLDEARGGPPPGDAVTAPAYVERTDEGDSAVRLTYWTLYGMHGAPGEPTAHEGDWERVDVLLRADGDRYEPLTVQTMRDAEAVATDGPQPVDTAWGATRRVDGTHAVVTVGRATHAMTVARRGASCADCLAWRTWDTLSEAREQLWYGFGGAWGEVGATSATTGPLGPHRYWPSAADKLREFSESVGSSF